MRLRSLAVIVRHGAPGANAARAALTALSMSAFVPAAHSAITSSRAGSKTSNVPPSAGATHSLLMSKCFGRFMNAATASFSAWPAGSRSAMRLWVPFLVAVAGISSSCEVK